MSAARPGRRLVVTICPRERGRVCLPIARRGPIRRLDARAILRALDALTTARGLSDCVRLQEGCAGGCHRPGPNISVTIYPAQRPGERPNHIALAWKTYVYTLPTLDTLSRILDDNL